jgi:GxxExxY protein
MKERSKSEVLDMDLLTRRIIGAAIEVHRHLGPGLLESAYEECLCYELNEAGVSFLRQVQIPIAYKEIKLDCKYRLDLIVEDAVIVELKCLDRFDPIHSAQLLTYLKAIDKRIGLLINFNVPVLRNGIKRIVNQHEDSLRSSPRLGVSAVNLRPL